MAKPEIYFWNCPRIPPETVSSGCECAQLAFSSGLMQTCYINNRLPEPVRSSEDTSSLNLCPVFSWTDVDVRAAPDKLFQAH